MFAFHGLELSVSSYRGVPSTSFGHAVYKLPEIQNANRNSQQGRNIVNDFAVEVNVFCPWKDQVTITI